MSSEKLTLKAEVRTKTGKGVGRKLRAAGYIPAVFYNPNGESVVLQVNAHDLMRLYTKVGRTKLFDLEVEGEGKKFSQTCLIWDVEYYPTRNEFMHVDFYGADMERELKIRVPLTFTGVAKGAKLGGKMEVYREHIYVLSKPATLPNKITVDITALDINQGLRVAELIMPEGVRASYDDNFAILQINVPGANKDEDEEKDK